MGTRESQGRPLRRVRLGRQGARQRPPGRDRRSPRPGRASVDEVAAEIGQSVANTSHHLRGLADAGLVQSRRDGQRIIYRLTSDRVARAVGRAPRRGRRPRRRGRRARRRVPRRRDAVEEVTAEELAARLAGARRRGRRPPTARVRRRPHRRRPIDPDRRPRRQLDELSPKASRSSPTAAAPIASTPTTPFDCSADGATEPAASTPATPNGSAPASPPTAPPPRSTPHERPRHLPRPRLRRRTLLQRATPRRRLAEARRRRGAGSFCIGDAGQLRRRRPEGPRRLLPPRPHDHRRGHHGAEIGVLRHLHRRPRHHRRRNYVAHARRSTLEDLTDWVLWADKTVTF